MAGDRLTINANVESEAQALITTPAAGKFYRSGGGEASRLLISKLLNTPAWNGCRRKPSFTKAPAYIRA